MESRPARRGARRLRARARGRLDRLPGEPADRGHALVARQAGLRACLHRARAALRAGGPGGAAHRGQGHGVERPPRRRDGALRQRAGGAPRSHRSRAGTGAHQRVARRPERGGARLSRGAGRRPAKPGRARRSRLRLPLAGPRRARRADGQGPPWPPIRHTRPDASCGTWCAPRWDHRPKPRPTGATTPTETRTSGRPSAPPHHSRRGSESSATWARSRHPTPCATRAAWAARPGSRGRSATCNSPRPPARGGSHRIRPRRARPPRIAAGRAGGRSHGSA